MYEVFQYILKWSVALGVVYLFYRFVLRPITFYQWNRRYLLAYSIIAFFIPFFNLYTYVQPQQLQGITFVQYIPTITISQNASPESTSINPWFIAAMFMAAGSLILLVRLLIQWLSLRRIRKQAVRLYHPEANVYHVDEKVIPFSFGDAIYVNTSLHTDQELNDIILHEFVHVKQKHSVDIIWSEILCILNWYNPFAWLIRHAIRQNLEFIADQSVLRHGLDKKQYQYHLLKVIGSPQYSIANNFNFSSLKKRIAMMNRLKSARVHLVRFLFVLPLLAVLLVAFRNNRNVWYQQDPPPAKADTTKPVQVIIEDIPVMPLKEFMKKNPSVKQVGWNDKDEIILHFKDGRTETYSLKIKSDIDKFQSAYGRLPTTIPPPPPPPTPGKPGKVPPEQPVQVKDVKGEYIPVEVIDVKGEPLPNEVVSVETVQNVVTVKRKNGEMEVYDTNKPNELEAMEKKYGRVIRINGTKTEPAVKVIGEAEETTMYADNVVIQAGVPQWYIKKQNSAKPMYFLNGKKSTLQELEQVADPSSISHAEVIHNRVVLNQLGVSEQYNAVINLVTKDNINNKEAYLAKESKITIQEAQENSRVANTLYLGIDNPIDIKVDGVAPDQIVVKMPKGGTIQKRDGRYFIKPSEPGNVEVLIYIKEGDVLKLVNKRAFRVTYQPPKLKTDY